MKEFAMKSLGLVIVLLLGLAVPARAQFVVTDPGNLAQTILIAERTLREYQTLWQQYRTILRMSQGLGPMDRYRIPSIGVTGHDPGRWPYGAPWLQGLNSGDARGRLYEDVTRRLERPGTALGDLSPTARRAIENSYATIELTDSIAEIGGHQVALVRTYSDHLQRAMQALESDILNPLPRYHELTAVLDKVAAGELLARRQDMAMNQLMSHVLEQLLARSKRMRDTEAATMNMRLLGMRNGRAAGERLIAGTANDLRTWRQP
jgi:hypothetical protein